MTNDEMERSINFVLDSQATLTAKLEKLTKDQARLTTNVERLTADIVEMKVQAELDRAMIRDAVSEMRQGITTMRRIAERMEKKRNGAYPSAKGNFATSGQLEKRIADSTN